MKHLIAALLCGCFTLAHAQTAQDLLTDGKNTENITTYGMGYDMKRYSPLKQINTSNVKRLVPVWSMSMANDLGEQAQPMIYNGVMYVTNVKWTFATTSHETHGWPVVDIDDFFQNQSSFAK